MTVSYLFQDTIFALSSGTLPSGVAVIRLSGPHVQKALALLVGDIPPARYAALRKILDRQGRVLDHGLVLFFPGPASFTGEDSAELQVHGGRAVVAALLRELAGIAGLRLAEAGDFTRRAFLNGKVDLTGAEALSDLISAETETQRVLALRNTDGSQKALYQDWGRRLLHARAMIEAELDFADEADVSGSVSDVVWADMRSLGEEIAAHLKGYRTAEIIRDGFRVVLIGAPNAGKSSLLNALAKREVAIVTEVPGTTRDLIEVSLDLDGVKVLVTDTAGIRETSDVVERIGVDRAVDAARRSDMILYLSDSDDATVPIADKVDEAAIVTVATKSDLRPAGGGTADLRISSRTGEGLSDLISAISGSARERVTGIDGQAIPFRARQVSLLAEGQRHLSSAAYHEDLDLELRAEELRLAARALERITGQTDVEDLLGVIFSEFCVGK